MSKARDEIVRVALQDPYDGRWEDLKKAINAFVIEMAATAQAVDKWDVADHLSPGTVKTYRAVARHASHEILKEVRR